MVGFWFIMQYIGGMATLDKHQVSGVAYWCHIGGFAAGFCLVRIIVLALRLQVRRTETGSEPPASPPEPDSNRPFDYHQARAAVFRDVSN